MIYIILGILISFIIILANILKRNKPISFKGKKIWITGASSGIGEALAYTFSNLGANLILTSRSDSELNRVRLNCKNPENIQIVPMDLSKIYEIEKNVDNFMSSKLAGEDIDILINNAGLSMRASCLRHTLENDVYMLNVNLVGVIALTKAILKYMMKKNNGQIVAISSLQGKLGIIDRTTYAASKHGVVGFFDSLRAELASTNISVTVICPGYVKTNLNKNALYDKKPDSNLIEEKGMDPLKFANIVARGIYNKEKEMIISDNFSHKLAVYLRNICSDLIFYIISRKK